MPLCRMSRAAAHIILPPPETRMNDQPVLVLVAPGFEEIELTAPVDILRRLGIKVVLAGVQGLSVEGAHGMTLQADMLLVDVESAEYRGVILPGGQGAWLLRDTAAALAVVKDMHKSGKLVAAICAAPFVLEAAGVLGGRQITCYPAEAVRRDISSVRSISEDSVVVDGNIITGRGPGAAMDFGFALGEYLGCSAQVPQLKKEMCYTSPIH